MLRTILIYGAILAVGSLGLQWLQQAESFAQMYANPVYRLPITFIEMFPVC